MDYKEFIEANRSRLLGYFLVACLRDDADVVETPYPPGMLSEDLLVALKEQLRECMPLESMIVDLWYWDIQFDEDLSCDWYFEAIFGGASSLDGCSEELADFFIEKCSEYGIDYNQSDPDLDFQDLVCSQAKSFISNWRQRAFERFTHSGVPKVDGGK